MSVMWRVCGDSNLKHQKRKSKEIRLLWTSMWKVITKVQTIWISHKRTLLDLNPQRRSNSLLQSLTKRKQRQWMLYSQVSREIRKAIVILTVTNLRLSKSKSNKNKQNNLKRLLKTRQMWQIFSSLMIMFLQVHKPKHLLLLWMTFLVKTRALKLNPKLHKFHYLLFPKPNQHLAIQQHLEECGVRFLTRNKFRRWFLP